MSQSPLILALDVAETQTAIDWVLKTKECLQSYKVGMQLFYQGDKQWLSLFKENNLNLFLDLKLYDIPNTVKSALVSLLDIQPKWITLHASGGQKMMQEAQSVVEGSQTELIAVTCLTSFSQEQIQNIYPGFNQKIEDWVLHLVKLSLDSGITNIVCSPQEVKLIREKFGSTPKLFTPGIRPLNYGVKDDQQRTLSPREALEVGSNYIIMGRPILESTNPTQMIENITQDCLGILN